MGARSTSSGEFSAARIPARSAALSLFCGTAGAWSRGGAGFRFAVVRETPAKAAAFREGSSVRALTGTWPSAFPGPGPVRHIL